MRSHAGVPFRLFCFCSFVYGDEISIYRSVGKVKFYETYIKLFALSHNHHFSVRDGGLCAIGRLR